MFAFPFFLIYLSAILSQASLIGNYKLNESTGNALYDFTLNSMHAEVSKVNPTSSLMISTDRGTYISNMLIKFPSNKFKSYAYPTAMSLSFYYLSSVNGSICMSLNLSNSIENIQINIKCTYSSSAKSSVSFLRNNIQVYSISMNENIASKL